MQRNPKYFYDWNRVPLILDTAHAAVLIQITPEHLRTLCRKGVVPAMQLGQEWRISREVVRERLNGRQAAQKEG